MIYKSKKCIYIQVTIYGSFTVLLNYTFFQNFIFLLYIYIGTFTDLWFYNY